MKKDRVITSEFCDARYGVELYLKLRGKLPTELTDDNLLDLAKEYKAKMDNCEFEELRKHGKIPIFAIYHHCNNIIRKIGSLGGE